MTVEVESQSAKLATQLQSCCTSKGEVSKVDSAKLSFAHQVLHNKQGVVAVSRVKD